jgi:hypothetical protein
MPSIISKVTEFDKKMRQKVTELDSEKSKLPVFLREQKQIIMEKYTKEAKDKVNKRKAEVEKDLKEKKQAAEKLLNLTIEQIENYFKDNKEAWVKEIYQQCLLDYLGE